MTSVFISYARSDGLALASRLREALDEVGHRTWMDVDAILGGDAWAAAIEQAIDECDVTLALISDGSYRSEMCRAEQTRTLRKHKRLIPVLVYPRAERPLTVEHLHYRDFTDAASFEEAFQVLLNDLEREVVEEVPAHLERTPIYTPKLEAFVARPEELSDLRRAVLGEEGPRDVSLTALRGMGGVGKTTLALLLCRDELVRAAFPDGIFWITIGRDPGDLASKIANVGALLGDRSPELYTTIDGAAARLTALLSRKSVLLVLDDVWEAEHVRPLLLNLQQCRTLITTRDASIGSFLGATPVRLGEMEPEQSIDFLRRWSGLDDPLLAEIADRVGHLPLALRLAASQLRDTPPAEWLRRFRGLSRLRRSRDAAAPTESCEVAFQLSVDRLRESDRRLYFALGIFPEDVAVPLETVIRYWRHLQRDLTAEDCEDIADHLEQLSLLELQRSEIARAVEMHDLLLMYARERVGDEGEMHRQFLAAHNPKGRDWASTDDPYILRTLLHHLTAAGKQEEVQRLLFDLRWLSAKLNATSTSALILDYRRLPAHPAAQMVRKAMRLAATTLEKDRSQLAPQLLSRLSSGDPDIDALLAAARDGGGAGKAWLRPTRPGLIPAGGCLQQTFVANNSAVRRLICRDGRTLEARYDDGWIYTWDVDTGSPLGSAQSEAEPEEESDDVQSSPLDANRVIRPGKMANGSIEVRDRHTGELLFDMPCECPSSHSVWVVLALDERRALTGSHGAIGVWNLVDQTFITMLEGHTEPVRHLERIDENRFASGADDGVVRVWDVSEAALMTHASRHSQSIMDLCATPRGVVSSSYDDRVLGWDIEGDGPPEVLVAGDAGWVRGMLMLDDNHVASGSVSNIIRIWQLQPPDIAAIFFTEYREFPALAIDASRFVTRMVGGYGYVVHDRWRGTPIDGILGRRLTDIAVIDGDLWITTDDGLYRWREGESPRCHVDAQWLDARFVGDRYVCYRDATHALQCRDLVTGESFEIAPRASWRLLTDRVIVWREGEIDHVFDVGMRTALADLPVYEYIQPFGSRRVVVTAADVVRVVNLENGSTEASFYADGKINNLSVVPDVNIIAIGDSTGSVQILKFEVV